MWIQKETAGGIHAVRIHCCMSANTYLPTTVFSSMGDSAIIGIFLVLQLSGELKNLGKSYRASLNPNNSTIIWTKKILGTSLNLSILRERTSSQQCQLEERRIMKRWKNAQISAPYPGGWMILRLPLTWEVNGSNPTVKERKFVRFSLFHYSSSLLIP